MDINSAKYYFAVVLTTALISFASAHASGATGPMPYTNEALARLDDAMEKIPPPKEMKGDADYRVKTYVSTYRQIFSAAGFDYERSVMRIINDIQFDRYSLNKATIRLNGLARELLRLHVTNGVHPKKYLNEDCAELLLEFRNLILSNMKKYGGC